MLRYVRTNGRVQPAEAESVEVSDDGRISGWRSVSDRAVGSFAGTLPDAEVETLQGLVGDIAGSAPPNDPPPPDAATESLELDGAEAVSIAGVRGHDESDWGRLAAAARGLLDRMTDFPLAAVGLTSAAGAARLQHHGTEPLQLDLTSVQVRVTAWRGYYEPAGDWSAAVAGPGLVVAEQGWFHDLPVDPDFAVDGRDITVHLRADFAVLPGDQPIPVAVSHTPAPRGS